MDWITRYTVLQYQNFDPNRKDNYAPHDKEDCVLLEPSGFWDDSICTEDDSIAVAHGGHQLPYRHSYICQYPTTGSQTTTTTTTTTTKTPLPSTIAPMLSNMTGNVQLCPRIVRDTTDDGYIRQYKQYCYELVSKYGDWYDANQYCRDRETGLNGLLIEIYTADIQAFIAKILADEGYTHPVWIGLQDVDKEESFDHWESDTPLSYANFDPNRKDNYANHAQENCVLLEPSGYWDDSVCDEREANQAKQDGHPGLIYNHHWICQYPIHYQNIIG
ncbi:C-type mannose receptor 2-like [Ruditapes philippinarum]|uniref:C-type mannose receptor 2-like n=1 Tax=Ruditapes philippinarum TaxID=129788 RepID=UPI00295BAC25|nr:C-type mannose receptor 2-like [Ruditapes philippinarum]